MRMVFRRQCSDNNTPVVAVAANERSPIARAHGEQHPSMTAGRGRLVPASDPRMVWPSWAYRSQFYSHYSTTMTSESNPPLAHQSKKKRIEDDMLPPDAGQKPIQLQRRRVWRACESCRRKKIKCDGVEPTCAQCATSGSTCTWLQTKDRAALSRHYVQELEARLLHMESLFSQIAPVLDQLGPQASNIDLSAISQNVSGNGRSGSTASMLLQSMAFKDLDAGPSSQNRQSPDTDSAANVKVEDDMSESFGQLALDEHGHMRWIGGSSTMSLIQSFRALTTSPLHRVSPMEEDPNAPGPSVNKLYFPASVFFGRVHALPGPEEVEYPERDLADKLVDAYFSRLHFLMPVIDKPSFLEQYKATMDHARDKSMARSQTAFLALLFAVFACAAQLVDDSRLAAAGNPDEGGMGMVYYERALILHYISHASIQISHVQCFILMSSFLCSVNCLPQAWLLVGQAVRSAQDLGLHRSPRRLLITAIEKETRRKVWWGVYALDRMLALALGRPLGIEDSDCDVEWPIDVDDEELPEYFSGGLMSRPYPSLMAGTIALTNLYRIAGRVLREVYALDNCKDNLEPERRVELQRTVENLDRELTKWCDELPVVFKSGPVNEKQVSLGAVLCSHYYSVLTTLHRNFLPVKRDQPVAPKSTAKAVSSARSCIRLAPSIKSVVPPSHHLAFFIQHLFSSAVIILLYAMHASDPRAAAAAMEEGKGVLVALESWVGSWPGAYKCKELLSDLTHTASEAIKNSASGTANGGTPGNIGTPGPVERRRSITISTPSPPSAARMIKSKPTRRNRSRDPVTATRRPAVAQAYRLDTQRARSTSRKRGHDEAESREELALYPSYQNMFPGPNSPRGNTSPHSSPGSVNLPSPSVGPVEGSGSPRLVSIPNSFNYSGVPLSPLHDASSPTRYDFSLYSGSVNNTTNANQWNGNDSDSNGLDLFGGTGQNASSYSTNAYNTESTPIDINFMGYNDLGNPAYAGLSTTPPTASFNATGLPFRGLDFIRNYNPEGYAMTGAPEQDSVWQSFDAGAFGYDPELPFTLGDSTQLGSSDGQQAQN